MLAAVPQIRGLTVENILDLSKMSPNALRQLPDERDWDVSIARGSRISSILLRAPNLYRSSRML